MKGRLLFTQFPPPASARGQNWAKPASDKKLLWRANLYIDEGVNDWNNMNPWVGSGVDANQWGENQWNRFYDGSQTGNIHTLPLLSAPNQQVPAGGQVVRFNANGNGGFTPFRTVTLGNQGSTITNSVSYDYDDAQVNAWDSPFDFVWKMNQQKQALRNHFEGQLGPLNALGGANGAFPTYTAATPQLAVPPTNGVTAITNSSLANWNNTRAPYNRWKYYWKRGPTNGPNPFIPGLGFWRTHQDADRDDFVFHTGGETLTGLQSITFNNPAYSAGVDCMGFAVRAAAYVGQRYRWFEGGNAIPQDRAEGDTNPDSDLRGNANLAFRLAYPVAGTTSDEVITWRDVNNFVDLRPIDYYTASAGSDEENAPETNEMVRLKFLFKKVLPGDMIAYGPENPTTGEFDASVTARTGSHIGVVRQVYFDQIEAANTIADLFGSIEIIESVYNQRLFFVFVRKMNQGPNNDTAAIINRRTNNNWYRTPADNQGVVRYRSWSIHRMRVR